MLSSIIELKNKTASLSGHHFYKSILSSLADILDIDYMLIGKYLPSSEKVQALVYSKEDQKFLPLTYDLKDTPCEMVTQKRYCVYEREVANLFPKDILLKEMNIEGYVGVFYETVFNEAQGVLVALTHREIIDADVIGDSLKLYSDKVSEELKDKGVSILNPDLYK